MAKNVPQKRKYNNDDLNEQHTKNIDTSKPTAYFTRKQDGRKSTISVALPGSIIANAHTHDLKNSLAGQLARAFAVFCVHEVIIFDDGQSAVHRAQHDRQRQRDPKAARRLAAEDEGTGYTAFADPDNFLYHVLTFLETPPYLRKALFSHHPNLKTAGSLPSLDMPHHLRGEEWCRYREAVTVDPHQPHERPDTHAHANSAAKNQKKKKQRKADTTSSTTANAGLPHLVSIDTAAPIPVNTRVTLDFGSFERPLPSSSSSLGDAQNNQTANVVAADTPRLEAGYYWGYTTRLASSLSSVFTESPFDDGYDYSIGTSERGQPLSTLVQSSSHSSSQTQVGMPKWSHLLIVFGGVAGLERALRNDSALSDRGVTAPADLFDAYINLMQNQGSRTIRTEEAVWMGLMALQEVIRANDES